MVKVTFRTERPFIIAGIITYALIWKLHYEYYTPCNFFFAHYA